MSQKRNPNRRVKYFTPDDVLGPLVRELGPIGLDPATDATNPTDAKVFFTEADNGLVLPWDGYGLVYCNPPYEEVWYPKIGNEAAKGIEMVALVKGYPTNCYFQDELLPSASAVCFWRNRLTFKGEKQGAGFGSALLYYGPRSELFRAAFSDAGWTVPGGGAGTRRYDSRSSGNPGRVK